MIDIKKVISCPTDEIQVIKCMIKSEQKLLDAIHIMQSILDNPSDEYKDFHEQNIRRFLNQFEADKTIQQ